MADLADILAVPDGIARAGHAAAEIATGVRGTDVAGLVRAAGAALPGSSTAAAAQNVASRWQAGVNAVADGFTVQADALGACARTYKVNEQQLTEALRTSTRGMTPLVGPR